MAIGTYLAIYFIVWWTSLFIVLPWGVRSQAEDNSTEPGTDPGAPIRPRLLHKAIATSLVAVVITSGLIWIGRSGLVTLEDFPMPFKVEQE